METKEIKIGKLALEFFTKKIQSTEESIKFDEEMLLELQDETYSKLTFGARFPILTKTVEGLENRYYVKPVSGYYITNYWIEKQEKKLEVFIDIQSKRFNAQKELSTAIKELGIDLGKLVAKTAIFVNPETVEALKKDNLTRYKINEPIWRPNCKRKTTGLKGFDNETNLYLDDNTMANQSIKTALGFKANEFYNYEVCHIWPKSCYDIRYHTCITNIVLIPRAIASLTDFNLEIEKLLQYRAFDLYNWVPKKYGEKNSEHDTQVSPKEPIQPASYDVKDWKHPFPCNETIINSINRRQTIKI